MVEKRLVLMKCPVNGIGEDGQRTIILAFDSGTGVGIFGENIDDIKRMNIGILKDKVLIIPK